MGVQSYAARSETGGQAVVTKDVLPAQTIYKSIDVFKKDLWVFAQDVPAYIPKALNKAKWKLGTKQVVTMHFT